MTVHDNDIAALFDPKLDDPVPVIPPGALPPSWAAAQSHAPQPARAWSEAEHPHAPDLPEYDYNYDDTDDFAQTTDPDQVAEEVLGGRRRRTGKKRAKSATDRDKAAAKKRADRERKAVRLKLTGTSANINPHRDHVYRVVRPTPGAVEFPHHR